MSDENDIGRSRQHDPADALQRGRRRRHGGARLGPRRRPRWTADNRGVAAAAIVAELQPATFGRAGNRSPLRAGRRYSGESCVMFAHVPGLIDKPCL